jgi:hypothetical protein
MVEDDLFTLVTLARKGPLAIVVGDKCRNALRSLLRKDYEGLCVESLQEAFALCRQKAREHEQQLREKRGQAALATADVTIKMEGERDE